MTPTSLQPTPYITDPVSLFMFFLGMIGFVFYLSETRALSKFFDVVPPLVFCYFLPMATTTLNITPADSILYKWFNATFLPAILLLLLISADIRAILKLGPKALLVMLAGSVGVMLGAVVSYAVVSKHLHPDAWKNLGALAGTWIGGSVNMFAVKSALDIDDKVFSLVVPVDPILAYSWMGILIFLASKQKAYAARFKADDRILDEMNNKVAILGATTAKPITTTSLLGILAVSLCGGYLASKLGDIIGASLKGIAKAAIDARVASGAKTDPLYVSFLTTLSPMTVTVILITAVGIVLSFTPLRRLEERGASKIGYAFLYLLLPTFGAQADLRLIGQMPWYFVCGLVMMASHASFTFIAMYLLRLPLFFGATASQANVGGAASASVVASTYQPALAPVGVLLGIFGGIIGTYCGLVAAQICRFFAPN